MATPLKGLGAADQHDPQSIYVSVGAHVLGNVSAMLLMLPVLLGM